MTAVQSFRARLFFCERKKSRISREKVDLSDSGTAKITDQRSKISMGGNVIYLLAERWKTIEQLYSFFLN